MTWGSLSYKIYPPASYGDAKAQCEADGSFLAIPRSQAENDFFGGLISHTPNVIWIGINDIEKEGSFVGVDGSEISWTNWGSGGPNYDTSRNGVVQVFGNWYEDNVDSRYNFVCSDYIEGTIFLI